MSALPAFTNDQERRLKRLLSTQVASMMGRKLEEGDWTQVYCRAKGIPDQGWSNLHIDVVHEGLGLEIKLLRVSGLGNRPLKSVCGTTLMHPAATRSIRVDTAMQADRAMEDVFHQYGALIEGRRERVRIACPEAGEPDMRVGWLLWEESLTDFLYFEEKMAAPDAALYRAEWSRTAARGVRKESRSLWIFDKITGQKRYSVTTAAGAKIQPYFDVPAPGSPGLYELRAQSEPTADGQGILLWVAASTRTALEAKLGELTRDNVSRALVEAIEEGRLPIAESDPEGEWASSIEISFAAYQQARTSLDPVSDEHIGQLLLSALA